MQMIEAYREKLNEKYGAHTHTHKNVKKAIKILISHRCDAQNSRSRFIIIG